MYTDSSFPSPQLTNLIKEYSCISVSPDEVGMNDQIVIDDGCYDFVFFKGKEISLSYGLGKKAKITETVFTIHQLDPPHKVSFDQDIEIFVAKVQPWANASFFPPSMRPGLVDLKLLFPNKIEAVYQEIFQTTSFSQKIEVMERFLPELTMDQHDSFFTIQAVCKKIYETNGMIKVNELVDLFKINRQLLNKKFKSQVQYTIKQFIKIVRIMSLIKYKITHQEISLSTAAYQFDYADQSHFNNDFKKVCGISPTAFFDDLPVFFQRHKK